MSSFVVVFFFSAYCNPSWRFWKNNKIPAGESQGGLYPSPQFRDHLLVSWATSTLQGDTRSVLQDSNTGLAKYLDRGGEAALTAVDQHKHPAATCTLTNTHTLDIMMTVCVTFRGCLCKCGGYFLLFRVHVCGPPLLFLALWALLTVPGLLRQCSGGNRHRVTSNLEHQTKCLPVGELSWRRNQRHLRD